MILHLLNLTTHESAEMLVIGYRGTNGRFECYRCGSPLEDTEKAATVCATEEYEHPDGRRVAGLRTWFLCVPCAAESGARLEVHESLPEVRS